MSYQFQVTETSVVMTTLVSQVQPTVAKNDPLIDKGVKTSCSWVRFCLRSLL